VDEVRGLAQTLDKVVDSAQGELWNSTDAERRAKRQEVAAGGKYKHMDRVSVKRGRIWC
jgi:hypothetical protein